jgi:transposase
MLRYKAELLGIQVIEQEESYTSKASFIDLDPLPVYTDKQTEKPLFSGKRVSRGLYKSGSGKRLNADVNGSLNILRKAVPNAFSNGIEGVVVHPVRFTPTK